MLNARDWLPLVVLSVLLAEASPHGNTHFTKSAIAADAAAEELAVRRWLVRLDADRKVDRQTAEEELLRLGPGILKWLPDPQTLGSRSASEAVRRVRAKLERQKAEAAVEASRLALGGSRSLAEILEALPRETGNTVVADGLPKDWRAALVELPERPTFWDVLEAISQQQQITWRFDGSPSRLRLLPIDPKISSSDLTTHALNVTQTKAFRVAMRSAAIRKVVGQADGDLLRLELDVASEPRLRPLFVKCAVDELKLTGMKSKPSDDASANENVAREIRWEPFSPDATLELTFGQGRRQLSLPVDFRIPIGVKLESLSFSGRLHVQTAAAEEAIEFPAGSAARSVARRRGGVTVKVDRWETDATSNGRTLTVSATVLYDAGGPAFESHRSWMLANVAGLVKSVAGANPNTNTVAIDNSLLLPNHGETNPLPNGAIEVTYRFERLPASTEEFCFRYIAPTLIFDVPLDFDLNNVPWPLSSKATEK